MNERLLTPEDYVEGGDVWELAHDAPALFYKVKEQQDAKTYLIAYAEGAATKDAEYKPLVEALEEIKRDQGYVCQDFELCTHESCRSSYTSWAIADKALAQLEARKDV